MIAFVESVIYIFEVLKRKISKGHKSNDEIVKPFLFYKVTSVEVPILLIYFQMVKTDKIQLKTRRNKYCSGQVVANTNALIFLNFLYIVQVFLRRVVLAASCPAATCHRPPPLYRFCHNKE